MQQNQETYSKEYQEILNKINTAQLPLDLRQKALSYAQRVDRLVKGGNYSEYESILNYINWLTNLPFGNYTRDNLDLDNAMEILDKHHYGLKDVKNKILDYLAVFKLNSEGSSGQNTSQDQQQALKELKGSSANAPIMLFIGIQGIGKTSMVKSIANALGRKFIRVALGGITNANELRGRNFGSENAEPGLVVKALINSNVMNPLILFDEMDKVSKTGGTNLDIMATLLEVFDSEQNTAFTDRYLDSPIDLSKCMFIATANNIGGITSALLDRMEIIRFTSYNDEDKKQIAKNYLLPKVRKATGLTEEQLVFQEAVWDLIIRPLGFDAGIRELERTLTNVARKVARKIVEKDGQKFEITSENFREYIPDDFGVYA